MPSASTNQRHAARCAAVLLVALLATLAALLVPVRARAADYSISKVSIDAQVATDGSVTVTETRTFDFTGDANGVYWDIPTGETSDGRTIRTTVNAVSVEEDGHSVPFSTVSSASNGHDGVYTVTDDGDSCEVKIYHPVSGGSVRYTISYTDTNLAERFQDTAELYWKFVSDGWSVESRNVTCTVHLPVPTGVTVVHDGSDQANVRAWGHGPLDASLALGDDGTVTYTVPGVGTDEFAEARIVFPAAWLSAASPRNTSRLQDILKEEQGLADEANAERGRAQMRRTVLAVAGIGVPILCVILSIVARRIYRWTHKPQFDDTYFRDVPSADHPAVLGALLHGGTPAASDLTASLMRLTDEGYVRLDRIKDGGPDAYCLVRLKAMDPMPQETTAQRIDRLTLDFLFGEVRAMFGGNISGCGPDTLAFSDISDAARLSPKEYARAYDAWRDAVSAACDARGLLAAPRMSDVWLPKLLHVIVMVTFGIGIMGLVATIRDKSSLDPLMIAVCVVSGVSLPVMSSQEGDVRRPSPEAIELTAKLEALRRWLRDFTRLGEAVPQDVVLWNRLLVMAVVLGVSKEVIDQLRIAAPQVLEEPTIMPVYVWCAADGLSTSPAQAFGDTAGHAHDVTDNALSNSSPSSGGGGGGGFSSGGGGGFGGGGGGGAF